MRGEVTAWAERGAGGPHGLATRQAELRAGWGVVLGRTTLGSLSFCSGPATGARAQGQRPQTALGGGAGVELSKQGAGWAGPSAAGTMSPAAQSWAGAYGSRGRPTCLGSGGGPAGHQGPLPPRAPTDLQAEEQVEGGQAHMPVLHPAAGVADGVSGDQPLPLRGPGRCGHLLLPLAARLPEAVKEAPRQARGVQH